MAHFKWGSKTRKVIMHCFSVVWLGVSERVTSRFCPFTVIVQTLCSKTFALGGMAFITPNSEISSTALRPPLLCCSVSHQTSVNRYSPFLVLFPSFLRCCLTIISQAWSLHESSATESPQTGLLLEPEAEEENKAAIALRFSLSLSLRWKPFRPSIRY